MIFSSYRDWNCSFPSEFIEMCNGNNIMCIAHRQLDVLGCRDMSKGVSQRDMSTCRAGICMHKVQRLSILFETEWRVGEDAVKLTETGNASCLFAFPCKSVSLPVERA